MNAPRLSRWTCVLSVLAVASSLGVAQDPWPAAAQEPNPFDPAAFAVGLELVADGLDQPVHVADPSDGSGRLFVVEQPGRIRIVRDREVVAEPFLDIVDLVESEGSEQGLLSVAFAPDFSETGTFYVGYTARSGEGAGDNTVARYRVAADDPDRADPDSGEVLLAVPDPFRNHNGGLVLFGPDGSLYVGLGDGGSRGDPEGNGQNAHTLLGSLLRLDVRSEGGEEPYAIPPDNPFADGEGGRPEVWAYGLRNPWRFSFDRATGDLYVADVGQGAREEVNFQPAASDGGENYGWNIMEGTTCYAVAPCDDTGLTLPVTEYATGEFGCAVTGGYVYRGEAVPELDGVYLFADYCSGLLWGLGRDGSGAWVLSAPVETGLNISSFGEDAAGELYVTVHNGGLYRVTGGA